MNYFTVNEGSDKPCKDTLNHPLECFVEIFLATPAVIGTFLLSTSGFLLAVLAWVAILALFFYLILALARITYKSLKYVLCHTSTGLKIKQTLASTLHLPQPACCRKAAMMKQSEKQVEESSGLIEPSSDELVGKTQPESRWLKSPFKHLTKTTTSSPNSKQKPPKLQMKSLSLSPSKLLAQKAIQS